ncbi:MAG: PD40 domain-containing protein [Bacteroidia bacterium]|nr:PD40 domain-containing protein [Bacteroidia bacterium]NNF30950.1 OmpA family protein [Flavobacteriaceae bacterium]MBT8275740.1 PD40 domain-containing protein [Bacteroidia bacterium]NNJ82357.1 OmpA family protein [Flavobacteriaceae bacterium]NNK54676.1 OmpA family protein [Flavobacteriaceae bacterium]
MKKLFTILLLIAVSTTATTAQNKDTKKADQLYARYQYTDAAAAYQKLLKKGKGSRYVFQQLGNSYYFINDTKKAETYYRRVVKGRKLDAEVVYNYAQSLKANGKFSDHNTWMKRFAELKPDDSRAKEFMKNPNYIPLIMDEVQRWEATNLEEINSEYADFGAFVMGKEFYFTSGRNTKRKKYGWNEEPYLDIYKAQDVGGTIKNASLLPGTEINTKYHEGTVAISPDGKRMYFDRNDFFQGDFDKSEDGVNQINLYYAELIDGQWKGVQSVPWNSDEYSNQHPALSPDGNTLYFTSDMPGGMGKSDIYRVAINTDGTFSEPQNVGALINTEGREGYPSVDSNGTLYFSSDGRLGIGMLDVFSAEIGRDGFGNAKNMGKGVNSANDDFAFVFNPATMTGYVSSNRDGGKGGDDIYAIKELEIACEVTINVKVLNEYTDGPISGARVDMYDEFENSLSSRTTAEDGTSSFTAECDKGHVLQGIMKDFESNAVVVESANNTEVDVVLRLRPIEEIIVDDRVVLNPIFFDLDKSNIKPQAAFELDKLVAIMLKYPNMVIKVESHTDNRGNNEYNLGLSERRAQSTVQYVISKGVDAARISGEGKGETAPKFDCGANCTKEQHDKNRRSEFIIVER